MRLRLIVPVLLVIAVTAGAFVLARLWSLRDGDFVLAAGLALAAVTAVVAVRSERRRRAAREVERYFAFAPDMVIVAGFDGYWKRVNPIVEKLLGYTEAEALSRPFMEFVHPDDRERTEEEARRVVGGATALSFVNRIVCKDGSYKWIEWTATPVPEERVMWGIGRDVTDRRRTESEEAALRRLATMVAEGLPPAEIFAAVSEEVGRLFGSDLTVVSRFDAEGPEGPANIVMGVATDVPGMPVGSRWELEDGLAAGRVFRTGRSARIDAVDWSDLSTPIGALARGVGVVSTVSSPIHVEGRLWGAISVPAREPLPPGAEERLEKFTQLVATAIANADSRQAVARLGDEQAALRRIATLVARGTPTDAVFQAVADEVAARLECDTSAIVRFDADGAATLLGGHRARRKLGERFLPHHGYVLVAVRESRQVARFDTDDPSAAGMPEPVRSEGIRSGLAAPIVVDGELWGAITVASLQGPFPPRTERRLSDFTDLIATAITNTHARERVTRAAAEQAALRRVATLVANDAPSNEVFESVATEVGKLFDTDITIVGRYDGDGMATAIGNWSVSPGGVPVGTRSALGGRNVLTMVAETGKPARVDGYDDASGEAAEIARRYGWRSSIAAPIVVEGRVWGVMLVATQRAEPFPAGAEHQLAAFTDLTATAISNAQARGELSGLGEEQAALRRVATLVARGVPPGDVFAAVSEEVGRLLEADLTVMGRYEEGSAVAFGSWSAVGEVVPEGTRAVLGGENLMTRVAETGEPSRMDAYDDATGEAAELARQFGWRSSIAAPIVDRGLVSGLILAGAAANQAFPPAAEHRLAAFTELVATAISNAEARDSLRLLAEEQAALRRVATLVARGVPPEDVFGAVSEEVGRLFDADLTVMGRYEGESAVALGSWSSSSDNLIPKGTRSSIGGRNLLSGVAETGEPARLDTYDDATGEAAEIARQFSWRSSIAAPIVDEGRVWGVMLVATTRDQPFPAHAEHRLAAFTELIATAVGNAEAHDEVRRFGDEQAALRRVATLVAGGVAPERVFTAVVDEVASLLELERIELVRYDGEATGTVIAAFGDHPFPAGSTWSLDDPSVMATVARTGRVARIDDYTTLTGEIARVARGAGFQSAIGAPITVEGRLWGVIIAISTDPEPIPEQSASRLGQFTDLVATAVANAEARHALERVAAEQATLRRIATLVAEGLRPTEVFAAVTEEVGRRFGTDLTAIGRFEDEPPAFVAVALGNGMQGVGVGTSWALHDPLTAARVFQSGRSVRVDEQLRERSPALAEMLARLGVVSTVASPIMVEGRLWGAAMVSSKEELPADTEERLDKFTELVATAVANAESRSELAASRRRIVAASDETRRQLERDLHDGTQQRLVSLGLAVRAAEASLPPERDDLRAQLSSVAIGLVAAVEDLQEISRGIHPAILSKGGLGPAVRALAHRSTVPVDLDITTDARLDEPIEVAAYFVASEALANAAKHAQASRIDVSLGQRDGSLVLSIGDDGVGGADPSRGSGLVGLTDRVEALGGSISVHSREGIGTQITAEFPLELEAPPAPG